MNQKASQMEGIRYGSLLAIRPAGRMSSRNLIWEFLCDCGNVCQIDGYMVRSGRRTTCQICAADRSKAASRTHGKTESREFSTWTDIQTRCYNRNSKGFSNYGGRGILVCDRWLESFENFLADMGPRPSNQHSIERNNVNGNYEPSNCRWATIKDQAGNKRNNIRVEIDGVEKIISEWCAEYGVLVPTACLRYKNGIRGKALFRTTKREIFFNGITDTVSGWSKRTGISPSTIAMRIDKYKWPVERALTQGASF